MTLGVDLSGPQTGNGAASGQSLYLVVPVYNEAAGLAELHTRLVALAATLKPRHGLRCEVIYVDDGSADDTLAIARGLDASALDVQVVSLSRNFGKEAALMAGLDYAGRGAVLFMDGDGQHPPALVEQLVRHWMVDGYDVVFTAKAHRDNESWLRRQAVRGFYALLNWGARQKIPEDAGDFRLLSPRAAEALRRMPERNRFFKGLASWIGFRQIRVDYEPAARTHGITSFNAARLIGLSIEGITSFSVAPLRIASLLGVLLALTAFLFGLIDPVGDLDRRQVGARLSVADGRHDDDRRRAAFDDRHRRRIYRQDPVRDEGAAGVFRRRAQRQTRRSRVQRARADRRGMSLAAPPRRIWLCADDYGISPGVNRAIRELLEMGRINATSVMMVGPAIGRDEAKALKDVVEGQSQCAIGLHVTLTAPFYPLSMHFRPLDGGMFLPLARKLRASLLRALRPRDRPRRDRRAARGIQGIVRAPAGLCRRPSACAAVSADPRRLPDRGEACRAARLGAAMRPEPAARPSPRRAEGAAARQPQRTVSRPRQTGRPRLQSGLRRRL